MTDITYTAGEYLGGPEEDVLTLEATSKIVIKCDSFQVRGGRAPGPKVLDLTTADGYLRVLGDRDEGVYLDIDQADTVYPHEL